MIVTVRSGYRRIRNRFRLRGLEWEHSLIAIGWGVMALLYPGQFNSGSYSNFYGGPYVWGWAVLLLGLGNVVALVINGTLPRPTALARTASAVLQVFLFLTIAVGVLLSGTGSAALTTYFVLALFGFPAAAWALFDALRPEYHDADTDE